ncbi:hypothetical protein BVY03_01240, partial [bacterium K02(2017)]
MRTTSSKLAAVKGLSAVCHHERINNMSVFNLTKPAGQSALTAPLFEIPANLLKVSDAGNTTANLIGEQTDASIFIVDPLTRGDNNANRYIVIDGAGRVIQNGGIRSLASDSQAGLPTLTDAVSKHEGQNVSVRKNQDGEFEIYTHRDADGKEPLTIFESSLVFLHPATKRIFLEHSAHFMSSSATENPTDTEQALNHETSMPTYMDSLIKLARNNESETRIHLDVLMLLFDAIPTKDFITAADEYLLSRFDLDYNDTDNLKAALARISSETEREEAITIIKMLAASEQEQI